MQTSRKKEHIPIIYRYKIVKFKALEQQKGKKSKNPMNSAFFQISEKSAIQASKTCTKKRNFMKTLTFKRYRVNNRIETEHHEKDKKQA